ncbi:response regulator [Lysinibacillus piscis]|uniref:Response regulatory domain-containing protein n=1 Tax=Lysinibacillus piscis TaxID=2518931 RepID=A0ABQ5NN26_9BACI|nr:response regulator [Lysinibacillus sp. KH24]GLC89758.1 hypothetical protein LYSBPC_28850 [Lysinibacillus sp. KH24]
MDMPMMSQDVMQEHEVKRYFNILRESVIRSHLTMTVVFLTFANDVQNHAVPEEMSMFLKSKLRKTDLLFQLVDGKHWGIFFLQSSVVEARAFLERIFNILEEEHSNLLVNATITEIRNNDVSFDTLITQNKQLLTKIGQKKWAVEEIIDYQQPPTEHVKVSVIEQNQIFRQVLEVAISQLVIPHFSLEVSTYEDGYSFFQSNNYKSAHIHLIITNDILPRKNGFEILHLLRAMPNGNKFIIYMMSERNSESVAINAYDGGADEFITKPFNLRLLEAKIKRTFERLWL